MQAGMPAPQRAGPKNAIVPMSRADGVFASRFPERVAYFSLHDTQALRAAVRFAFAFSTSRGERLPAMQRMTCSISIGVGDTSRLPGGLPGPRMNGARRGGLIAITLIGAVVIMLAGCASSVSQQAKNERAGGTWEAVFLPESTQEALDANPDAAQAWEGRRDGTIQLRIDQPVLASAEWPEAPRDSLNRYRYINLGRQPENVLYFRPERENRRGW